MALIWMDSSGDHYSNSEIFNKWTGGGIGPAYSNYFTVTSSGRTGNGLLAPNVDYSSQSQPWYLIKNLDSSYSTLVMGTAVRFTTGHDITNTPLIGFFNSRNISVVCGVQIDGSIAIWNSGFDNSFGQFGFPAYTSDPGIVKVNATWYYFEMKANFHATTGSVSIRVNGREVLNQTNIRTSTLGSEANQVVLFGAISAPGSSNDYGLIYDDIYVTDGNFLGDTSIVVLNVSSSGVSGQWVPSGAINNFQCVNETVVDGDTTFVYSSSIGTNDTYRLSTLPGTILTINGLQPIVHARKDNAGLRTIAPLLRSGTSITQGLDIYLNSGYELYTNIFETDPNTSSAWTTSAVNLVQLGIKLTG